MTKFTNEQAKELFEQGKGFIGLPRPGAILFPKGTPFVRGENGHIRPRRGSSDSAEIIWTSDVDLLVDENGNVWASSDTNFQDYPAFYGRAS